MGTRQARPMRSRSSSWTGSAARRTRCRKDGPLGEEEEEEETLSRRSEWEETQPATSGVLLRENTDTGLTLHREELMTVFVSYFCVIKLT